MNRRNVSLFPREPGSRGRARAGLRGWCGRAATAEGGRGQPEGPPGARREELRRRPLLPSAVMAAALFLLAGAGPARAQLNAGFTTGAYISASTTQTGAIDFIRSGTGTSSAVTGTSPGPWPVHQGDVFGITCLLSWAASNIFCAPVGHITTTLTVPAGVQIVALDPDEAALPAVIFSGGKYTRMGRAYTVNGNTVTYDSFSGFAPFTNVSVVAPVVNLPADQAQNFTFTYHATLAWFGTPGDPCGVGDAGSSSQDVTLVVPIRGGLPVRAQPCPPTPTLQLQPQAGQAQPGETVHYQLTAGATSCNSDPIQQLTIQDTLPDASIASLILPSVTGGGQVNGRTISWGFPNGSPQTVAFDLKVNDASRLPAGTTELVDAAHVQATTARGAMAGKDAQDQLTITPVKVVASLTYKDPTGGAYKTFYPGDTVTYTLSARVDNVPSDDPLQQVQLVATLPPMAAKLASLVNKGGGQVSGSTITWTVPAASLVSANGSSRAGPVSFTLQMKDRQALLAEQFTEDQPFNVQALATATLQSGATSPGQDHADATLHLTTVDVRGVIRNVIVHFPDEAAVDTKQPLAGALVRLWQEPYGSGYLVGEATTDDKGTYSITVDKPGDYTLEVYHLVGGGGLESSVTQLRDVSIDVSQLTQNQPVLIDDIHLPIGLVSDVLSNMAGLSDLQVPLLPTPGLAEGGTVPGSSQKTATYHIPGTDAADAVLTRTLTDMKRTEFKLYRGTGTRDEWNALLRLDAAMGILRVQATEDIKLVDAASLAAATGICLAFDDLYKTYVQLPLLQKFNLAGKNNPAWQKQLGAQLKILHDVLFGGGTPLSSQYPLKIQNVAVLAPLLQSLGVSQDRLAYWINLVSTIVDYGLKFLYGELERKVLLTGIPGTPFPGVFEILRTLFRDGYQVDGVQVLGLTQALIPGYARYMLNADDRAANLGFAGDTTPTLTYLVQENQQLILKKENALQITSGSLQTADLILTLAKVYESEQKLVAAGGSLTTVNLGQLSGAMNKLLGLVFKVVNYGVYTGLAAVTVIPGYVAYKLQDDTQILGGDAFSGEATLNLRRRPAAIAAARAHAQSAAPPAASSAAALDPTVPAYLALLARAAQAVHSNDTKAYDALAPDLLAADLAFADYTNGVYDRGVAALPMVTAADTTTAINDLLGSRPLEALARGFLYPMLDLWEQDPTPAAAGPVLDQLQLAEQHIQEAGAAAASVAAALHGVTVPGTLALHPGDSPLLATPGQTVTVSYQVTNAGDTAVAAGTVQLAADPSLQVIGPLAQSLPALGPHQSVTVAWMIQIPATLAENSASLQVSAAPAGAAVPSVLSDMLVLVAGDGTPLPLAAVISPPPLDLTCPPDLTVGVAYGDRSTVVQVVTPTAGSDATVTGVRSDGAGLTAPYPLGSTTITWTAVDAAGDQQSCTQTITVTAAAAAASDGSVVLQTLTPNSGPMGQTVILHGQGFGNQQGQGVVLVGGRQVSVLFWTPGAIGILMNPQAFDPRAMALDTSYPVQVVLPGPGRVSNPVSFLLTSGSAAGQ